MKTLALIFIFLCPTSIWSAEQYDEIDLKIYQTLGTSYQEQDQSWLTDELRPIVIGKILAHRSKSTAYKYISDEQLVSIGHVETIQRMVEESQINRNNNKVLLRASTEETIPYLMPIIYTGSTETPKPDGDIGYSFIETMVGEKPNCDPRKTLRGCHMAAAL